MKKHKWRKQGWERKLWWGRILMFILHWNSCHGGWIVPPTTQPSSTLPFLKCWILMDKAPMSGGSHPLFILIIFFSPPLSRSLHARGLIRFNLCGQWCGFFFLFSFSFLNFGAVIFGIFTKMVKKGWRMGRGGSTWGTRAVKFILNPCNHYPHHQCSVTSPPLLTFCPFSI